MSNLPEVPHKGYALVREILARSVATTWPDAKQEWELSGVVFSAPDDPGTCLCGHFPIRERCVLTNRETGAEVVVGNVCVKKFLDHLGAEGLVADFRKIMRNHEAALGAKAIDYAYRQGWINDWERDFGLNTCRKRRRTPSPKERRKRAEINAKIIAGLTAREEARHA